MKKLVMIITLTLGVSAIGVTDNYELTHQETEARPRMYRGPQVRPQMYRGPQTRPRQVNDRRGSFESGRRNVRGALQNIHNIQRELQYLRSEFNRGVQDLHHLNYARPYNVYHARQLSHQASNIQQRLMRIHQRGQYLSHQMQNLIRSVQRFAGGSTREQIGSIYEALDMVTEGDDELNRYVRLGGDLISILDRAFH